MNLPECPNHLQGVCERNEIILLAELKDAYSFHCKCCSLFWIVSKDRTKQAARHENRMKRIREATEAERARAAQSVRFMAPRSGWVTQ